MNFNDGVRVSFGSRCIIIDIAKPIVVRETIPRLPVISPYTTIIARCLGSYGCGWIYCAASMLESIPP